MHLVWNKLPEDVPWTLTLLGIHDYSSPEAHPYPKIQKPQPQNPNRKLIIQNTRDEFVWGELSYSPLLQHRWRSALKIVTWYGERSGFICIGISLKFKPIINLAPPHTTHVGRVGSAWSYVRVCTTLDQRAGNHKHIKKHYLFNYPIEIGMPGILEVTIMDLAELFKNSCIEVKVSAYFHHRTFAPLR